MEDLNTKSVRYPASVDAKFLTTALKLGRPKRLLFIQMVDYFYKSKKDPLDLNDEILKNALLKSHKEYIGFIKTQETELLIPIKTDVRQMITSQKTLIDFFNTHIINHNSTLLGNQQKQINKFLELDELIRLIHVRLDNKEKLKKEFVYIFESYVKVRDSFGLMTSGKEKEELILKINKQISSL